MTGPTLPNPNVVQCLTCRKFTTVSVGVFKEVLVGKTSQWCNHCQMLREVKACKVYKLRF